MIKEKRQFRTFSCTFKQASKRETSSQQLVAFLEVLTSTVECVFTGSYFALTPFSDSAAALSTWEPSSTSCLRSDSASVIFSTLTDSDASFSDDVLSLIREVMLAPWSHLICINQEQWQLSRLPYITSNISEVALGGSIRRWPG